MAGNIGKRNDVPYLKGVASQFDKAPERPEPPDETDDDVADLTREEVKAHMDAVEAKAAAIASDVRADMSAMKNELLSAFQSIRTDHAKDQVVATRWAVGVMATILIAAFGTIITTIVRTGPATAAQSSSKGPEPMIIQVPAYVQQAPSAPSQPAPPAQPASNGSR